MKARAGDLVSLYYDSPRIVKVGEFLQTTTGRAYLIDSVRRQAKGAHVGRWHIKAIVCTEIPQGSTVHPIYWYKRGKR